MAPSRCEGRNRRPRTMTVPRLTKLGRTRAMKGELTTEKAKMAQVPGYNVDTAEATGVTHIGGHVNHIGPRRLICYRGPMNASAGGDTTLHWNMCTKHVIGGTNNGAVPPRDA